MTLYTLLSNHLTKATPEDNTLGIVFYNVFFDVWYQFQVF